MEKKTDYGMECAEAYERGRQDAIDNIIQFYSKNTWSSFNFPTLDRIIGAIKEGE